MAVNMGSGAGGVFAALYGMLAGVYDPWFRDHESGADALGAVCRKPAAS